MDIRDDGEPLAAMMPLLIGETSPHRAALNDLGLELATRNAELRGSLAPGTAAALADLVRSMNCYYSNLIEGHDTHPIAIDKALRDDYSQDPKKRNLQKEARAHIEVQAWIDDGGLDGRATAPDGLLEIHRRFCSLLPDDMLWVEGPGENERHRVVPGELRAVDVEVGRHVPISPGAVPRFLAEFDRILSRLGPAARIAAAAGAHHRFLWIHPFVDGNGRVARLMSHAMLRETLNTGALWSIARGLARRKERYYALLEACDMPRQGDRDGRGNLSEQALAEFSIFFLTTCIDQVSFMQELLQPAHLGERVKLWSEEQIRVNALSRKAADVLDVIVRNGALSRGDVSAITGTVDRQARRIVSELVDMEIVRSTSSRAPLRIAFPAKICGRWLPGLFPESLRDQDED